MVSHGSRIRTYINAYVDGKRTQIVSTWSQNRCKICQRFLGKRQLGYCAVHATIKEIKKRFHSKKKVIPSRDIGRLICL